MADSKSGNVVSFGGGKFKARIDYSITDGAVSFTPVGVITAAFDKEHYCYMKYMLEDGTWSAAQKTSGTYKAKGKEVKFAKKSAMYNGSVSVMIKFSGSEKWSTATFTPSHVPVPTSLELQNISNTSAGMRVTGSSGIDNPAQKIVIERSTTGSDAESWDQAAEIPLSSGTSYDVTHADQGISAGNRYWWRAKATNTNLLDSEYKKIGPYYTGANSSDVTGVATSVSGGVVTVTWNCSLTSIAKRTIVRFEVLRGDASVALSQRVYESRGSVDAVTGQSSYSFSESVVSGITYEYKIKAISEENEDDDTDDQTGGDTGTGSGTTTETPPSAPAKVTVYRDGNDYVNLTITGESSNADNVVIERNIDNAGWNQVESASYPLSTWQDTSATASDNIRYRVKYTNSAGDSSYTYSDTVKVRQKPAAPLLTSPVSGSNINIGAGTVRLIWTHRPLDGSPQVDAQLRYKLNSGSWNNVTSLLTAAYYDLDIHAMDPGDVITWQVRTKGTWSAGTSSSDDDFSDWSAASTMTLQTKPILHFTSPVNASNISVLPLVLTFSYSDGCGTLKELNVDVVYKNKILLSENVDVGQGTSGTYTHSLAGFLFENGQEYTINAYSLSSSGLSSQDSVTVNISFAEKTLPGALIPIVTTDSETGYAYFTAFRDKTPVPIQLVNTSTTTVTVTSGHKYRFFDKNGTDTIRTSDGTAFAVTGGDDMVFDLTAMYGVGNEPATVEAVKEDYPGEYYSYSASSTPTAVTISSAYLYRVHDGETMLVSAITEGQQIRDRYAPINTEYEYKLFMYTQSGQVLIVPTTVYIPSPYWFVYWGKKNIAKAKWNPEGSVKLSRPQKTQVRYSGRRYPVSYDQDAVEETFDFSATILERDDLLLFKQMMREGGQGIWKSGDGDVYDADFEFDYSADFTQNTLTWNASLSVTRIDGGE